MPYRCKTAQYIGSFVMSYCNNEGSLTVPYYSDVKWEGDQVRRDHRRNVVLLVVDGTDNS